MSPLIAITGANGQLGSELRILSSSYPDLKFIFLTRNELSLENENSIEDFFQKFKPQFLINCAAYTAVDKAETERELSFLINGKAAGDLALSCKKNKCKLVHISTDYVFNGNSSVPYKENDPVDPVNAYGASKLEGENRIIAFAPDSIIIRTAWVYSAYGHNFVKTMLRLMKERKEINVVNDQTGSPTWAQDLAKVILEIIQSKKWIGGIYHYSNNGRITWYDFAKSIAELTGTSCKVNPIPSSAYPTPAKRPAFSLMDTNLIRTTFQIDIPDWKESLVKCLAQIKKYES
ncbi:MAG: dTDP-4-dehydrorhamnose reductase [Bacteroidetes bacterium]|nr:MAG: dTDP-4-dehydrorhamnose reductase [Bacteroidota bacterium]